MAAFMKTPSGIFTRSPMDLESKDTADRTAYIRKPLERREEVAGRLSLPKAFLSEPFARRVQAESTRSAQKVEKEQRETRYYTITKASTIPATINYYDYYCYEY